MPPRPVTIGGDYWAGSWCKALLSHGYGSLTTRPWLSSGWEPSPRVIKNTVQMPSPFRNVKMGAVYSNMFPIQRGNFYIRLGGPTDTKCRAELWIDGVRTTVIPHLDRNGKITDSGRPSFVPPYPNFGRQGMMVGEGKELPTWQTITVPPSLIGKNACVVLVDDSGEDHLNVGEAIFSVINMPHLQNDTTPIYLGWADLHTHPAAHLAFGGGDDDFKGAIWGRPGMSYPANASQLAEDLPSCDANSHGTPDQFQIIAAESTSAAVIDILVTVFTGGAVPPGLITIGGSITAAATSADQAVLARKTILDSADEEHRRGLPHGHGGYPRFDGWPTVHSVLHQQMHINWVKRAYDGGCRMIVASAVDNQMMGAGLNSNIAGLLNPDPRRDFDSAVRQVQYMKRWVEANPTWMKACYAPSDMEQAYQENKMAVVFGTEVDMVQDLESVKALWDLGVRHFTLIHLMDNDLGGSAVYQDLFNFNNIWAHKKPISIQNGIPFGSSFHLSQLPTELRQGLVGPGKDVDRDLPDQFHYERYSGQINLHGISSRGFAVYDWLKGQGGIIDLAHMGNNSVEGLLNHLEGFRDWDGFGYPAVFSHGGVRSGDPGASGNERAITESQAIRLYNNGGLIGLGTNAKTSIQFGDVLFQTQMKINNRRHMPQNTPVPMAIGSDINGMDGFVQPRSNGFDRVLYAGAYRPSDSPMRVDQPPLAVCQTGTRKWNYNLDGAVHFGMFPDWLQDWFNSLIAPSRMDQAEMIMNSAEAYLNTWKRADRMKNITFQH